MVRRACKVEVDPRSSDRKETQNAPLPRESPLPPPGAGAACRVRVCARSREYTAPRRRHPRLRWAFVGVSKMPDSETPPRHTPRHATHANDTNAPPWPARCPPPRPRRTPPPLPSTMPFLSADVSAKLNSFYVGSFGVSTRVRGALFWPEQSEHDLKLRPACVSPLRTLRRWPDR